MSSPMCRSGSCRLRTGCLRLVVYELSDVLAGKLPALRGLPSPESRCFCFEAHFTAREWGLRRARARRTLIPRSELSTRPEDFMLRRAQARETLIPLGPLSKTRHERKRGRGEVMRESYLCGAVKGCGLEFISLCLLRFLRPLSPGAASPLRAAPASRRCRSAAAGGDSGALPHRGYRG